MRQSLLFSKTRKEIPSEEVSQNAQLLIRAGFIHKEMAGVYAYLPLGLQVLAHIKQIVREEMNMIGAQELIMTSLQRQELWKKSDRWDDKQVDVWFKTALKNGTEIGLAWSHEEPITDMMRSYLTSYRDLPAYVYQFQTKLRNELRAKSGIMRGREFLMKDLYSYSKNEEAHEAFYTRVIEAYHKVFARVGIGQDTFFTFASGGAFTEFSHEFQTICETGEDTIYIDREKNIAINEEVYSDEVIEKLQLNKGGLEKVAAAEVGNIFNFGGAKSEQLELFFVDEDGNKKPIILGSYGIGITRLMGVVVEKFADEKGIVWPEAIAPFQVHVLSLYKDKDAAKADQLYQQLHDAGIKALYDDRVDVRPGEKFADSDLIGIPVRLIVSPKTMENNMVEMKKRTSDEVTFVPINTITSSLKEMLR